MFQVLVYIAATLALGFAGIMLFRKGNRLWSILIHGILCLILLPVAAFGTSLMGAAGTGWTDTIIGFLLLVPLAWAFIMFVISISMKRLKQ